MQAQYPTSDGTQIQVTLAAGETLGPATGPTTLCCGPQDPVGQALMALVKAGSATIAAGPASTNLTFLQFMALFTAAEKTAIVNSADPQVKLFLLMATGAGAISLTNAETVSGVNYLAATSTSTPPGPGLIAASRVAQILAGGPPPAA